MEGPRPLFDHELNDLVKFLSTNLRPGAAWTIKDEYPLAITDSNLNNVRVIKNDGEFLSAAVMKPMILKSPVGIFKAGAIGSVVTNPLHRNQGFSRQILDDCIAAAKAHGCDFAILWTDLFDFYRKLGFELGGTEISLSVPHNFKCEEVPGLRFVNSNKVDPEAILRLYSQHTAGSVRTADEIRRFLQIPNARVYTAWDEQNRLQAYAVEGKGVDLEGYVHEWGGGVSKLLPLLRFATQDQKKDLTIITPPHSQNLIRQLRNAGASEHTGVLGMIKILNAPALLTKIKKYIRATGTEDVVLEARDGRYYMGYGEEVFSTDSDADLVRLLFGPLKASELKAFDKNTAEVFERLFPVSLWIWGWDSV
jgi:predicted acetyltransferase